MILIRQKYKKYLIKKNINERNKKKKNQKRVYHKLINSIWFELFNGLFWECLFCSLF